MTVVLDWRDVCDFWFPSFLDNPRPEQLAGQLGW
jgi:hypothetical protein